MMFLQAAFLGVGRALRMIFCMHEWVRSWEMEGGVHEWMYSWGVGKPGMKPRTSHMP